MQVGQLDTATKYKKAVRKFEEGTAQQWINVLKDMIEIWTQNGVKEGSDRAATVTHITNLILNIRCSISSVCVTKLVPY